MCSASTGELLTLVSKGFALLGHVSDGHVTGGVLCCIYIMHIADDCLRNLLWSIFSLLLFRMIVGRFL